MSVGDWKVIWQIVFIIANVLFYSTILYVTVRGSGDLVAMIRHMLSGKRDRLD